MKRGWETRKKKKKNATSCFAVVENGLCKQDESFVLFIDNILTIN